MLLAPVAVQAARIVQDDEEPEDGSSALEQFQNQTQVPGHDPWSVARLQFCRGCLMRRAWEIDQEHHCDSSNGTRCCTVVLTEKLENKHRIRSRYSGRRHRMTAYWRSRTYHGLWRNNTHLKEELATHGFIWKAEKQECDGESANASFVLSRVEGERDVCGLDEAGQCSERDGLYCPEGHSPAYRRGFNNQRFAASYSLSFLIANPIDTAIATSVVLAFTPTMSLGAAVAAGYAFKTFTPVPFDFITAAGLSAVYASEPRTCKCFPDDCIYDEEADLCRVNHEQSTGNPFSWLPYPGTKCAKVPTQKSSGFECHLEACGVEDFRVPRSTDAFQGAIGHGEDGGLFNCVADSDNPTSSHGVEVVLPDGSVNTAANRTALYITMDLAAQ